MDVLFNIFGYPLTYIEFFGVIFYFISIYLAIKMNIWTWATGIVAQVLFFIIFLQSRIYANATLQVFFIILCIIGWIRWGTDDHKKPSILTLLQRWLLFLISIIGIVGVGTLLKYLPITPDPYPYLDVSIFVLSVIGILLLTFKKIETWIFWIIVNIVSIVLYLYVGYYFIVIQDIVLIFINFFALRKWNELPHHNR